MNENDTRSRSALRELRDAVQEWPQYRISIALHKPDDHQLNAVRHALMRATDVLGEGDAQ